MYKANLLRGPICRFIHIYKGIGDSYGCIIFVEEFTTNTVLLRIEELLHIRHWTHYRLAKESGIAYSSVSNMFNRNTVPSVPTLFKICSGLKISMSDFFRYEEKVFSETITLAKNIEGLDEYKKNLLITYINCLKQSEKN